MSRLFFILRVNPPPALPGKLYFYTSKSIRVIHFQSLVTQMTGQFPDETYLNGLRDNPESTLAVLYDEFRMPIIQTIQSQGGTEAQGAEVFQLAVNDAARLGRQGKLPQDVPFFQFLSELSLAHYHALEEPTDIQGLATEAQSDLPKLNLPGPEALQHTREKLFAWENLQQLDADCQRILRVPTVESENPDESTESDEKTYAECREAYLRVLAPESEPNSKLPDWAEAALNDKEGYSIWLRSQTLEQDWMAGQPETQESNRIWRWAVGILLLVAVGYGVYQFYFRPKTAAEVFADNFSPPVSLMDDWANRYGDEIGNDSSGARPNECQLLLREADVYYQANDYEAATDPLLLIVLDSSSICQSDAWYYLGILQLKMEDPTTAIQCFAKIEDLGRYGEDLYWYQALAFVQLAKENPLLRDKARRAIERTLGNSRDSKRRTQAEKMLKNLSQ